METKEGLWKMTKKITRFYCTGCNKLQLEKDINDNNGFCPNCGEDMSKTYDGENRTIEIVATIQK